MATDPTTKIESVSETDKAQEQQQQLNEKESKTEFVEISFDEQPSGRKAGEIWNDIKFYALPLLSFLFFAGIIFGTVVPNISQLFGTIDQINSLREQDKALQLRIDKLAILKQENDASAVKINKINTIVPTGITEVVNFGRRLINLASSNSILVEGSKSGEDFITQQTELADEQSLTLIEIPTEFNLRGKFESFRNLLNALYEGNDFFIVDEMNLRFTPTDEDPDNWSAIIELAKYQFFAGEKFDSSSYYSSISEDTQALPVVLQFLESRFLETDTIQPTTTPTPTITTGPIQP